MIKPAAYPKHLRVLSSVTAMLSLALLATSSCSGKATVNTTSNSSNELRITLVSPQNGGYYNDKGASIFDFSATGRQPIRFECVVDGNSDPNCVSGEFAPNLGEDTHSFRLKAADASGRTTEVGPYSFTIDRTPPQITSLSVSSTQVHDFESISFNYTASDRNQLTFHCQIDSRREELCGSATQVIYSGASLTDGIHHFLLRVTDPAGNEATSDPIEFRVIDTGTTNASVRYVGINPYAKGVMRSPRDIEITDDGWIYVADYDNHRIQRFSVDGDVDLSFELPRPKGVDGQLWASQFAFDDPEDGQPKSKLQFDPKGVTVDDRGYIYVLNVSYRGQGLNSNYRVMVFDAQGFYLTFLDHYAAYDANDTRGIHIYKHSGKYILLVGHADDVRAYDVTTLSDLSNFPAEKYRACDYGSYNIYNISSDNQGFIYLAHHNGTNSVMTGVREHDPMQGCGGIFFQHTNQSGSYRQAHGQFNGVSGTAALGLTGGATLLAIADTRNYAVRFMTIPPGRDDDLDPQTMGSLEGPGISALNQGSVRGNGPQEFIWPIRLDFGPITKGSDEQAIYVVDEHDQIIKKYDLGLHYLSQIGIQGKDPIELAGNKLHPRVWNEKGWIEKPIAVDFEANHRAVYVSQQFHLHQSGNSWNSTQDDTSHRLTRFDPAFTLPNEQFASDDRSSGLSEDYERSGVIAYSGPQGDRVLVSVVNTARIYHLKLDLSDYDQQTTSQSYTSISGPSITADIALVRESDPSFYGWGAMVASNDIRNMHVIGPSNPTPLFGAWGPSFTQISGISAHRLIDPTTSEAGIYFFMANQAQDRFKRYKMTINAPTHPEPGNLTPVEDLFINNGGSGLGQLKGPYDIVARSDGTIFVVERKNHRIQAFDWNGNPLGTWGSKGSRDGELLYPLSITIDETAGLLYVADYGNDRVVGIPINDVLNP